jgi:hypothetical protein
MMKKKEKKKKQKNNDEIKVIYVDMKKVKEILIFYIK